MESDGRIRSKDIGTGEVNSRALDNIRSSNFNGSHTDPENDPGTEGWQILKRGHAVINEAIVRGTLIAARIISGVIESGSLVVQSGGSIQVQNSAGAVIVTLDELGLLVEGTNIAPPPIGSIFAFGAAAAPTGYLLCQGQAVDRTTYSALFGIISTTYGVGDGSSTFNLPNLQQRFPLGKATSGTGSTLGGTGGAIDHTHTGPSHSHTQGNTGSESSHSHSFSATTGNSPNSNIYAFDGGTGPQSSHAHSVSGTTGSGSSHAHTNPATGADGTGNTGTGNPPFQVVNYIIKH